MAPVTTSVALVPTSVAPVTTRKEQVVGDVFTLILEPSSFSAELATECRARFRHFLTTRNRFDGMFSLSMCSTEKVQIESLRRWNEIDAKRA